MLVLDLVIPLEGCKAELHCNALLQSDGSDCVVCKGDTVVSRRGQAAAQESTQQPRGSVAVSHHTQPGCCSDPSKKEEF